MSEQRHPAIIGHRGASGYRPEHTRSAYELAFALGADSVEPDLVSTRDGVLVLRHENEISGTTDVASRPGFADRRTTKEVDGEQLTGWFTEDFTWEELRTLRAVERLPEVRPASTAFDGREGLLRLEDLLEIVDAASERQGRALGIVAELKHADYFASMGLPLDAPAEVVLGPWERAQPGRLVWESFEQTVLESLRAAGAPGRRVFLVEASGAPADLRARDGEGARSYAEHLSDDGLARLAESVDGVSIAKSLLLRTVDGEVTTTDAVSRIHAAGMTAFLWTLRPENRFLEEPLRRGSSARDHGDWMAEFELVMRTGIDGVFLDHPDLGVVVRDALGR